MKFLNVLNMKRIIFPFLVMVMLGLSSCMKPGENIQNFSYLPAIVDFDFSFGFILKTTPLGILASNEIQTASGLDLGDPILAFFSVNYDKQPSTEYTIVENFEYIKGSRGYAAKTSEGVSITGDYDLPIEMVEFFGYVNNYIFLGFVHKGITDKDCFIYEMTYGNTPELFIRAKKIDTGSKNSLCAFSMYSFFMEHKDAENKVEFTIKYKTGVDDKGDDVFKTLTDSYGNTKIKLPVE